MKQSNYFLGSNTNLGFYSYFDKILNPQKNARLYIIKGGPGSGKSTLMKRLLERFIADGDDIEKFYCSSDPNSLDGVLSLTKKVGILDGTSPHVVEPKAPGAFEIILNTGEGFKSKGLSEKFYEIEALNQKISAHHKRAQSFIKSAGILREQGFIRAEKYLNYDAVYTMAEMLPFWRFLKTKGEERVRLISAVSTEKIVNFNANFKDMQVVYGINDPFGVAAHYLIKKIKREANKKSLSFNICPCACDPSKYEHIVFSDGVAFTTQNPFHTYFGNNLQNLDGFYLPMKPDDKRIFELEIAQNKALISLAAKEIARSKILHDELEKIYIANMDFSVIDRLCEQIIKDLQ